MKLLGVQPGRPAPPIVAKTLEGEPFKLADFRGKVVLVNFWATWCVPCRTEIPRVRKLREKHGDRLAIVSISLDQDAAALRRFLRKNAMPWTHLCVTDAFNSEVARAYNVTAIPAMFLIGPDGRVIAKDLRGKRLSTEVRKAVEQAAEVRTAKTEE